jgi:hypothetical protein
MLYLIGSPPLQRGKRTSTITSPMMASFGTGARIAASRALSLIGRACRTRYAIQRIPTLCPLISGSLRRELRAALAQLMRTGKYHPIKDSAQVTDPGAIISTIAAVSSRPNKQNRSTCSRMPMPIAACAGLSCEPVHTSPCAAADLHRRSSHTRKSHSEMSSQIIPLKAQ